jgi:hypothetical protein
VNCVICGCELNEHYQYELCTLCKRPICLKGACNAGGRCKDGESCEKAQAFNRLMQVVKLNRGSLRCPVCGGAMASGEGYKVCVLCRFTAEIRPP